MKPYTDNPIRASAMHRLYCAIRHDRRPAKKAARRDAKAAIVSEI